MRIGFIGLGIMGGAIARNLHASGWRVFGFDTNNTRREELRAAGIEIVPSAQQTAARAPIVLVSLSKPEALTATCSS